MIKSLWPSSEDYFNGDEVLEAVKLSHFKRKLCDDLLQQSRWNSSRDFNIFHLV